MRTYKRHKSKELVYRQGRFKMKSECQHKRRKIISTSKLKEKFEASLNNKYDKSDCKCLCHKKSMHVKNIFCQCCDVICLTCNKLIIFDHSINNVFSKEWILSIDQITA